MAYVPTQELEEELRVRVSWLHDRPLFWQSQLDKMDDFSCYRDIPSQPGISSGSGS
jgi:hypothetical protein